MRHVLKQGPAGADSLTGEVSVGVIPDQVTFVLLVNFARVVVGIIVPDFLQTVRIRYAHTVVVDRVRRNRTVGPTFRAILEVIDAEAN